MDHEILPAEVFGCDGCGDNVAFSSSISSSSSVSSSCSPPMKNIVLLSLSLSLSYYLRKIKVGQIENTISNNKPSQIKSFSHFADIY